jgi:putative DNA primase/helicase
LHFLATVLCNEDGQPDAELINLVQEAFYYSLTADTSYRVSFWLVGLSGTGKSTLVNTLVMLAGDSHTSIDLNALARDQYQFAEVAGKRLVTFSEPDSREPLADGAYKRLVSKDPITARSPYGKPFSFVPQCKVWGSMNDLPSVRDRSDAVFGRVIIIPMNRVIAEKDKDYTLDEKLRAERAGIFNWALRGAARLRKQGFTKARQSEDARKQYQLDNDTERLFLSERCRLGGEGFVFNDELYGAYVGWCKESGYYPKAKNVVGKDWRRLGLVQSKTGDGSKRIWKGVFLSTGSVDIPF